MLRWVSISTSRGATLATLRVTCGDESAADARGKTKKTTINSAMAGERDRDQRLLVSVTRMRNYSFPPRRSSFPIATPDAAEIETGPFARMVARATSCLTGASTEPVSPPLFAVNVTTVPSGTGLPEQSRTGSVSTTMPLGVLSPLMRKLHGTEATSCTTLRVLMSSVMDAVICSGPADFPELVRNQAMPSCVSEVREVDEAPFAFNSNRTEAGFMTRL